jgi:hypothetical protein
VVEFATRDRRELWVGWATIRAIAANRVAPGVLDWYLGRKGIESQQADEPEDASRPYNLWEPVASDVAAHGRFDARATDRSPALWVALHRLVLVVVLAAVIVGLLLALLATGDKL